ncbi:hypothetical protein PC9H_009695 [Pleurotus ostreatus]|uniref:Uncharacterized protein n=1 Tax=Pleurotus ostreatus TaxID=5322 RepID=A0A8H6ZME2_PLEOS|nr:uncharacterized protein PC9H_009695 [Pleurotus ostreatus]KAF7424388.1 hypothetical protein PC9H_009695 [Pleurotus ostreatus]KAJ8692680.1 hypothetical protein PTI98_009973 [Pleurotus ostreatus]
MECCDAAAQPYDVLTTPVAKQQLWDAGFDAFTRRSAFAPIRTQRTNVRGKLNVGKCAETLRVDSSSSNETTRAVDAFDEPPRLERLASNGRTVLTDAVSNREEATTSPTTDRDDLSSDTRALDALLGFLSNSTTAQQPGARHPTLNTLRSLYVSVKHRNQLQQLSASQLGDLAALFGSLSISIPRHSHCTYIHPLVAYYTTDHTTDTRTRTYWPFVQQILQDKMRLEHTLANRDRFWIMRASLANLKSGRGESMDTQEVERVVKQARNQYLRIRNDSPMAEVHLPFLRALLFLRTSPAIDEFIRTLSHILSRYTQDPRLLNFVWSTLTRELSNPSSTQKERILEALLGGFHRTSSTSTQHASRGLGFTVATSLLPSLFQGPPAPAVASWVVRQIRSALGAALPLDQRWHNLVVLAKLSSRTPPLDTPNAPNETTIQWDVITFFKYLEQGIELKLSYRLSTGADSSIRDLVRSFWTAWKKANHNDRPIDITRAIVATFFRLSTALGDSRLKDACHRFCSNEDLYKADFPGAASSFSASRLITEFAMASLASNPHCWSTIIALMEYRTQESSWKVDLLSAVVDCAIQDQVALPTGLQETAYSLLADPSWPLEQRRRLLDTALTIFYLSGTEKFARDQGRIIAEGMLTVYAANQPSVKSRDAILRVLRLLISSENTSMALAIVRAIHKQSPRFFWNAQISQLVQALIYHRQYRSAASITATLGRASSVRQTVSLNMAREGATSLSRQVFASYTAGRRLTARESMLRTLKFRPRHAGRLPILSVVPKASRALHDPELVKDSIFALVHANRILAARKLFQHTAGKVDIQVRTVLGNMILHGMVHRQNIRNGRLVRTVLRTAELLASRDGFVRDRVTINILLKAVLRWRSFVDVQKVKALFDHMIRGGYPAALKFRPRGVPFSTPPTTVTTLSLPPLPAHISFVKHVRPMYKMFIKAFHLRGDRRAAAVVVGILKAEEAKERARKEELNRIMAFGKLKGQEAEVKKTRR